MNICFLFEITKPKRDALFLTSSDTEQNINGQKYHPYCGLNLFSLTSNDSGDNIAIIDGIYNQFAITKADDLTDASITIYQLINNDLRVLGSLICTFFSKQDLSFRVFCNSEVVKYQQSLLQLFSKTCRANFGDKKCTINPEDFTVHARILEFTNQRIKYQSNDTNKISFNKGWAVLSGDNPTPEYSTNIISHLGNIIDINITQEIDISLYHNVRLIPTCDKKYRTCCYSFNNKVNFRGEPHIPDINIIKN